MPSSPPLPVPAGFAAALPALVSAAGAHAERRFVGFFAAQLRNAHTRAAYARATTRFLDWCPGSALSRPSTSRPGLSCARARPPRPPSSRSSPRCGASSTGCAGAGAPGLGAIEAVHVAAWVELRTCEASAPTVKQELAALRRLFDWLVIGQVLPANPATAVRGPAHSVSVGKTPVLSAEQARHLMRSLPDTTLAGLRDRALIATMLYTFARVSAALAVDVRDVYREHHRLHLRLREKGGKAHRMPCHHTLEAWLTAYMTAAGLGEEPGAPLFQSLAPGNRSLSGRRLSRTPAWSMVRRRAREAGIDTPVTNHTFRGTGITAYLEHPDAKLEEAQQMAGHSDPKTTRLYDRRRQAVTLDAVERIRI